MLDDELTAWLGHAEATPEQRAELHRVADLIDERYYDDNREYNADMQESHNNAMNAASMIVLGDILTVKFFADVYLEARAAERAALDALTGALLATAGESDEGLSVRAGVSLKVIRKALGK